jgi:hypothetical protein
MKFACRVCLAFVLIALAPSSGAQSVESDCLRQEVAAHVREQFAIYGPRSANHEYFGFVYVQDGILGSAVVRSRPCHAAKCVVDSAEALRSMPRSAKVLGEWHTHPHGGSPGLSIEDVRGAYNNRHISCYQAFYSTPDGAIYAWSPSQRSVPVAMASRAPVGNYKELLAGAGALLASCRERAAGLLPARESTTEDPIERHDVIARCEAS